jgi:hypothetical protein
MCVYAPTNPARVDEMGVKVNFNNFWAKGEETSIDSKRWRL